MFIREAAMDDADHELAIYKHIESAAAVSKHPGRKAIRTTLDSFRVTGPDGEHLCLVHPPLWDSIGGFLSRNPIGRLPTPMLKILLQRVLLALDFLHKECQLVHTGENFSPQNIAVQEPLSGKIDIKADNIMFGIGDNSVFEEFEKQELKSPGPRKVLDGRIIYTSRVLGQP